MQENLYRHYSESTAIFLGLVAVFYLVVTMSAYAEEQKFCNNIEKLIKHSDSQFLAIRGDWSDSLGSYNTPFVLPNALSCMIMVDIEKSSYQCSWEFQYGDEIADKMFDHFQKEMRSCIGHLAKERKDQSVNHPDYYLSYYYSLPGGQANVTFKNKVKMMKTYVSIGIDGFKKNE